MAKLTEAEAEAWAEAEERLRIYVARHRGRNRTVSEEVLFADLMWVMEAIPNE